MPRREASDNEEERRAQKRAQKRQQKEDLRVLQNQLMEAQETAQRAQEDNEALRQQLEDRPAPARRDAAANLEVRVTKSDIKYWKRAATIAGRRAAALHAPFLDAGSLADYQVEGNFDMILDHIQRSKDSDEDLDDASNPAIYWDRPQFSIPEPVELVQELMFHLPRSPDRIWLNEWFQDALSLGIRKQRGDIVHAVAKHPEKIFNITNPLFDDRTKRPQLEEVEILLSTFMHIGEEDENGELDLSMFFRDKCIVRVIRLLLHGPSAILTGHRSSKSRKSHAQMWHVERVTPSLLAFSAMVWKIKFVLSGESSFEECGATVNYTDWYLARLRILEDVCEKEHDAYNELMAYHNRMAFPDTYLEERAVNRQMNRIAMNNPGMSEEDLAFRRRLRGED
ncbi:hypothetical protein BDV93DRAFT_609905 [Ceratobasidium sp. AG-I]|nr:hypothetical protein BDV93DRAFT_609905 [Ceratobasidium sp. AG-I]